MRRRTLLIAIALLAGVVALAVIGRGESADAPIWRARLGSLAVDRDGDVRNNLLADRGDPFALRRRLLAAPASGGEETSWREFVAAAAAPRPDYDSIDRAMAGLDPSTLPLGTIDAYRYLHLWTFWQRNRPGSAATTLAELRAAEGGEAAVEGADRLLEGVGEDGAVQLALPGVLRPAGAAAGGARFRLRRLQPLATRRLAISWTAQLSAPPPARTELVVVSAAGVDFARLAILPGGILEIVTPRATLAGGPDTAIGDGARVRLLWDAAAEEVIVETGRGVELRAPGAIAPLEPPVEIELHFPAAALLRDVVVAASPRGASTIPAQ
jgi:hypothetical protein